MIDKPNFFLLTGGPGVGKTALIEELRRRGERVVEETHRRIIREELARGGRALPWLDASAYMARAAREDIAIFEAMAGVSERVFFDRGILDSLPQRGEPEDWLAEAMLDRRYNARVFIPPPWKAIYRQDAERKQSFAECQATHAAIERLCRRWGYEPVEVPRADVAARADFVLKLAQPTAEGETQDRLPAT